MGEIVHAIDGHAIDDDGHIVFAPNPTSGLMRVPESGGEPQPLTVRDEEAQEAHRWPEVLPGSEAVIFASRAGDLSWDDAKIELVRIATGEREVLVLWMEDVLRALW